MKFYFVHFEHLKELQRDLFKFNQLCIATPTLYRHMVGLLNKWIHTFCFMILSGSARNSSFVWVVIYNYKIYNLACHGAPWMPLIHLSKSDHQSVWFMKLIPWNNCSLIKCLPMYIVAGMRVSNVMIYALQKSGAFWTFSLCC